MLIDGHAHACGSYLTAEDIIETLHSNGVDKVVLVPGELDSSRTYGVPSFARLVPGKDVVPSLNRLIGLMTRLSGDVQSIPVGNKHVHELALALPNQVIQFYWALLHRAGIREEIERDHAAWRYKGLKLHQVWESFSVESAAFEEVTAFAAQKRLPIFIHLRTIRDVHSHVHFVKKHPDNCFIIGHLFGLEVYIDADLPQDGVFFDISAPPFVSRKRVLRAIEHFGADHVIMGSDAPYGRGNLARNIRRVRELPISESDKKLILGGNLQRLLEL